MISIVIGAYNERNRLGASLRRIQEFELSCGMEHEVIVVDDGSTDGTADVIKQVAPGVKIIRYKKNRGKGYALRTGVLASKGDLVLISDADLSTPIEEVNKLLRYMPCHHIAIGSRTLASSRIVVKQPWWRQQMGRYFNRFVRVMVMTGLNDTQCGFKLFAGEIARELFGEARIDRFACDVEILASARKKGYRIVEVPIQWRNDPASKVNPIRDSLKMLVDLVKIRLLLGKA